MTEHVCDRVRLYGRSIHDLPPTRAARVGNRLIHGSESGFSSGAVDFVPGGWIAGDTKLTFLQGVLNCAKYDFTLMLSMPSTFVFISTVLYSTTWYTCMSYDCYVARRGVARLVP